MLMSKSWSLHDLSQQDFSHMHTLPIYTCHTPHILWKNPQAYNIQYNQNKTHANLLGIA